MIELWQELPTEFRMPNPEANIKLWRGDSIGKLATGMSCRLVAGDPEHVVLDIARLGYDALIDLVDRHTSSSQNSPLLSVAADIRMAQLFADSRTRGETIYEITVPGHRLLRDPENLGAPNWPKGSELFIVGDIQPSDISRIKKNNDQETASELVFWQNERRYIADGITNISSIPVPELPNPLGRWESV
jgi:hypothetical protein